MKVSNFLFQSSPLSFALFSRGARAQSRVYKYVQLYSRQKLNEYNVHRLHSCAHLPIETIWVRRVSSVCIRLSMCYCLVMKSNRLLPKLNNNTLNTMLISVKCDRQNKHIRPNGKLLWFLCFLLLLFSDFFLFYTFQKRTFYVALYRFYFDVIVREIRTHFSLCTNKRFTWDECEEKEKEKELGWCYYFIVYIVVFSLLYI